MQSVDVIPTRDYAPCQQQQADTENAQPEKQSARFCHGDALPPSYSHNNDYLREVGVGGVVGKPCPREFRNEVVRIARGRDPGVTAPKRMPASRTTSGFQRTPIHKPTPISFEKSITFAKWCLSIPGNFDGVPVAGGTHLACTRRLLNIQHPELTRVSSRHSLLTVGDHRRRPYSVMPRPRSRSSSRKYSSSVEVSRLTAATSCV